MKQNINYPISTWNTHQHHNLNTADRICDNSFPLKPEIPLCKFKKNQSFTVSAIQCYSFEIYLVILRSTVIWMSLNYLIYLEFLINAIDCQKYVNIINTAFEKAHTELIQNKKQIQQNRNETQD